ncbi:ribosomal protein S12 methylthiotransferase [Paucidesulfovibrio gracilis DSM 16080]|uniref:Ribosomal protein uS12 methylthiotransferase RimO n=1 Tax=Paucidesulfovibrio gracilis DSM 16080 TaxID=1121449 RepID=A0A1T4W5G2_9BACT|nr:30S ribosomal protein S12 methylthiotransferase RimO [Paucidesulfovibrio gracilis]SKA72554.1 ribosomal protein S12 methylthiotransferase [Paucidesulfovibrio gracilis DSM 16080]
MNSNTLRVHAVSLGCPKNRVDTERLLGSLGPEVVPAGHPENADLVLINTCGFIRPAVEESVDAILAVQETIAGMEPRPVLAVAGCLVSRYGQELMHEMPDVDIWLTTREMDRWPELVRGSLARDADPDLPRRLSTGPAYAYLKIGEGCSHRCAFCTIPDIRGPQTSFGVESLAAEAEDLILQGVPELVLVAQDVASYGSDLPVDWDLRTLLERLLPIQGLEWLRLMYLYPAGLTDDLLSFLADAGRPFLPYFDIPMQHAHPDVLKTMGRPFARDPRRVIDRVRQHFDDPALRTSMIVGYPGETDAHFDALCDFVRETRFTHLGVFAYQAEEGTPAAEMDDQVPEGVKEARREELMRIQAAISEDNMERWVGEDIDVLVEAPHEDWPGLYTGRAWFQAPEVDGVVYVSSDPGNPFFPGRIVRAEVQEAKTYDLVALA